jgi:pimeloyl-ACP methyl ester carboxylesterase
MGFSAVKKSTIVRAQQVVDLWFTLPPGPKPVALPEGGEEFTAAWADGEVRGQVWGTGPVVYLVHGWGGRGDQFAALVEPLVRAGYRPVLFDGPSHGASTPGRFGPTSTTGVELGRALDAVSARFGPAEAVVAHSMGALVTLLTMNVGWLGAKGLVFVAPMSGYTATMDAFQQLLGFGSRTRRRVDKLTWARVGLAPDEFELPTLWGDLTPKPALLVVHDQTDPQTSYDDSKAFAETVGADFLGTTGLGHNRVLRDPRAIERIIGFLGRDRIEVTLPETA